MRRVGGLVLVSVVVAAGLVVPWDRYVRAADDDFDDDVVAPEPPEQVEYVGVDEESSAVPVEQGGLVPGDEQLFPSVAAPVVNGGRVELVLGEQGVERSRDEQREVSAGPVRLEVLEEPRVERVGMGGGDGEGREVDAADGDPVIDDDGDGADGGEPEVDAEDGDGPDVDEGDEEATDGGDGPDDAGDEDLSEGDDAVDAGDGDGGGTVSPGSVPGGEQTGAGADSDVVADVGPEGSDGEVATPSTVPVDDAGGAGRVQLAQQPLCGFEDSVPAGCGRGGPVPGWQVLTIPPLGGHLD